MSNKTHFGLLPTNIRLFITGRNKNTGQLTTPLTPELEPTELREFIGEAFNMVPVESAESENFSTFRVEMEQVLASFLQTITNNFHNANNILFNQLIEYDKEGVFRSFVQFYPQMRRGVFKEYADIQMRLNTLYAHFFKKFKNTNDFRKSSINSYHFTSNSDSLNQPFEEVVNLLLMSIFCAFSADKESFLEERLLENDIKLIFDKLYEMLLEPNKDSTALNRHLMYSRISNTTFHQTYTAITGDVISDQEVIKYMGNHLTKWGESSSRLYSSHILQIELATDLNAHFDAILKMIGIMNTVKAIYDDCKNQCRIINSNTSSENDNSKISIHILMRTHQIIPHDPL